MDGPAQQRIAILIHSMNEGGAQQRLSTLANRFAEQGHMVDFIAVSGKGAAGRWLAGDVRHISLLASGRRPVLRVAAGLGALTDYLEAERPDVLMAGSNRVHIAAVLACSRVARPPLLVLRAAGHPLHTVPWSRPWKRVRELWRRPLEARALGKADLVIAVSRASADAIRAMVGERTRVTFIPNPTITERFRASLGERADHRWFDAADAGGDAVILGIGRIGPSKDFGTLIEAVAIANRSLPVRLILLGEGKRRGALEALAATLGLGDRVEFVGHVEAVGGWLVRADLLVSSSLREGSPGVIIEAFAAGLPVVATACPGGSAELLEGGTGGMLVPMRDPQAMARAIVAMLARPRNRAALRALAEPYKDDGRADHAYLCAFAAARARSPACAREGA